MNNTWKTTSILLLLLIIIATPTATCAQDSEEAISLQLKRDFGYGGLDGKIQGSFSLRVSGPKTLERVEFYMDGELLGEMTTAPFNFPFHTADFENGIHTMYAIGYTTDGKELRSNSVSGDFISGEQAWKSVLNILVPLIAVVLIATVLGVIGPLLIGKRPKLHPIGQYGGAGAAICKQCGFPFSRRLFAPNLVIGKLERCPHCRKWQLASRAFGSKLAAAEERLRQDTAEGVLQAEVSEAERLKRALEESRYE
jgi:hypothetical protein